MGKPRISAFGVIYESLGFAVSKFATVLRVAWLPLVLLLVLEAVGAKLGMRSPYAGIATSLRLDPGYTFKFVQALLILNPVYIGLMGVAVILQASYAVPLIRYASHNIVPHHRTVHLSFGPRHLKYVLACAVSFAGVIFGARFLAHFGMQAMDGTVGNMLQAEHAVFAEGSLHSIETVPTYDSVNAVLLQIDAYLMRIGINVDTLDTVVLLPVLILALYAIIRLFPLPFLAAGREPGDSYDSVRGALRLTAGWNIFPMVLVLILFVLIHVAFLALLWLAFQIFSALSIGTETLIFSFDAMLPDWSMGPVLRGLMSVIMGMLVIGAAGFTAALNAGLGGALVHRALRG
ncbi:hypothetical protein [Parvularcula sp. LCG005]|uniref:hypothetical protein n=1 Tax=Parvularcula sp. LCG005 TaxID=3078805 RepID=UPI002943B2F9|nr:hypothetical protein [Parvularcula sp. LCG005]WOI54774.1 hypothetical protein RUI03_07160 [Parvularcula sp. LCG005]